MNHITNSETLVRSGTYCIAATKYDVCVGGYIMTETSTWIPGYWHNGIWIELPLPENAGKGFINSISISNGDAYAAGSFYNKEGNVVSGYWKNKEWVPLTQPDSDGRILKSFILRASDIYWTGSYQAMSKFSDNLHDTFFSFVKSVNFLFLSTLCNFE